MADLINFNLPNLNAKSDDSNEMKFIKNYLSMFTEQVKFFLNNIDSDNYTESYAEALNSFVEAEKSAATQTEVSARSLENARVALKTAMATAAAAIKESEGGYIVFLDKDNDGQPDEFQILTQSPDYTVPQARWVFNKDGLAFFDANGVQTTVALTADGQIVANSITTGTLEGIGIRFDSGEIAGWIVETDNRDKQIRQTTHANGIWYDVILKNDSDSDSDKKAIYVNRYVIRTNQTAYTAEISTDQQSYVMMRNGAPVYDKDDNICAGTATKVFTLANDRRLECQAIKSGDYISEVTVRDYWLDEDDEIIRGEANKTEMFYLKRNGNVFVNHNLDVANEITADELSADVIRTDKIISKDNHNSVLLENGYNMVSEAVCCGFITSNSQKLVFDIPIPTTVNTKCRIDELSVTVRAPEGGYVGKYNITSANNNVPLVTGGAVASGVDTAAASVKREGNGIRFDVAFLHALVKLNTTTGITNNIPVSVSANFDISFYDEE